MDGHVWARPRFADDVEPVVEAAVEIAAIEADRDITIAAIQAETSEAAIDADKERNNYLSEGLEQCQKSLEALSETVQTLTVQQSLILSQLTPAESAPNPNPPALDESPVAMPGNLVERAEPEPEPVKQKRKFRWI